MTSPETRTTVQRIREGLTQFVAAETELAKAEVVPAAKHAGIGSGLFAGAAAFLGHALWMLIIALALAIGWLLDSVTGLSTWGAFTLGFVITAVISIIIAAILALIGKSQIKKVRKPEATIAEAKATMSALADAVSGPPTIDGELAAKTDAELRTRPVFVPPASVAQER